MVMWARRFDVSTSAILAVVALTVAACGDSKNHEASGDDSGKSGGAGESGGGSSGVGGAMGGTATGGGGSGTSGGSSGDAGSAGEGGAGEESAGFEWVEPTEAHRERAAQASHARLRTTVVPAFDDSVLVGTSTVETGEKLEVSVTEGVVWTEETGTIGIGGLFDVDGEAVGVLSSPVAASADGSVVVGRALNADGEQQAFRWTRSGGMQAILGGYAAGVAVSADGSVVLSSQREPVSRAVRWTEALGAVAIEPVAEDDATDPLYLSPDGATVVAQSSSPAGAHLVVWSEASGARAIENLPGYTMCRQTLPTARLSYGFASGGSCRNESGAFEPFVWAGGASLMPLGAIDALEGFVPNEPVAVTADGSIAVGRASEVAVGSRPYRWTEAGGFELIELPEGYDSGAPISDRGAMSEDGTVVVGTMGGTARRAFLWTQGLGSVVLLPLDGHDISDVWVLSADGSVAAGSSFRVGEAEAIEDMTAVYWRSDGVAHRIADELVAEGIELGEGFLGGAQFAEAPRAFVGYGSKDEVSSYLGFRAWLP